MSVMFKNYHNCSVEYIVFYICIMKSISIGDFSVRSLPPEFEQVSLALVYVAGLCIMLSPDTHLS